MLHRLTAAFRILLAATCALPVTGHCDTLGQIKKSAEIRLGYRTELEAIDDPEERDRAFERMVAQAYEHGKALNAATHFEIDDVIEPADSRRWIATTFGIATPAHGPRATKKRPYIDTW